MALQTKVRERYLVALDALVAKLEQDYCVLAAVLYGSLARGEAWEKSDIDIALQGLPSAKVYFDLFGDAMDMTTFPLDIVEIEKIEPEYRESIIENGKLIYERKQ